MKESTVPDDNPKPDPSQQPQPEPLPPPNEGRPDLGDYEKKGQDPDA